MPTVTSATPKLKRAHLPKRVVAKTFSSSSSGTKGMAVKRTALWCTAGFQKGWSKACREAWCRGPCIVHGETRLPWNLTTNGWYSSSLPTITSTTYRTLKDYQHKVLEFWLQFILPTLAQNSTVLIWPKKVPHTHMPNLVSFIFHIDPDW